MLPAGCETVIYLMAEIVPRWEWRTFGDRFGDAETAFAAQAPERVQESDELYLLSLLGDASVKIRDALMDVKHLQEVNADGLEQWLPVLKGEFPLPAGDVATVIETLGLDRPALEREQYTLDQLLDELVRPDARLRAVEVHKRRERHTIGGCMTELTQISAEGRSTRTIAVELEDPGAVIATVRSLGLGSRANTCLARGLKTLVGFGASRFAVIDVGTNSVKFHVAERRADGSWQTIVDRAEITRLGEGLDAGGRLQPEPVERTLEAIDAMVAEAHSAGVEAIAAVGTAGLRMAPTRADLIDAVRARSGLEIEVISGEDEARLAYLAASAGLALHGGALAVFDTGGGSSQFTFGDGVRVR